MAGKIGGLGGKKHGGMKPNSEPNVIPFIDIMLVLLIIFMVAAPVPTVDIKVDLPPPGQVRPIITVNKPTFVILEDTDGVLTMFVGQTPVSMETVGPMTLKEALINNPGRPIEDIYTESRIFVKADQETLYKNVMDVMNALEEEGFVKVGIVAEEAAS